MTSGQFTTADIGKTVYLSNSATACQEWRIADINHDNTIGTVDLFPKYVLNTSTERVANGHNCNGGDYYKSNLRVYLNTTIYNGFSVEIQNSMKIQDFYHRYSNKVYSDKIKPPSLTELGFKYTYGNYEATEGSIYPIFGTALSDASTLVFVYDIYGQLCSYWTRTHYNNFKVYTTGDKWSDGTSIAWSTEYESLSSAVGIIRF